MKKREIDGQTGKFIPIDNRNKPIEFPDLSFDQMLGKIIDTKPDNERKNRKPKNS